MVSRRHLLSRAALLGIASPALSIPSRAASMTVPMELAVNEAATATVSIAELFTRYEPMAKLLARSVNVAVRPEPFLDVALFQRYLDQVRPAFIFAKTVDVLAEEVVANRYVPMVRTAEPYIAGFVASPSFNGVSLNDLRGQLMLFPPADTMTSKLGMTTLRRLGIPFQVSDNNMPDRLANSVVIRHVSKNDVISSIVGNPALSWYAGGLLNPSALKKWKGRVFQRLDPQPNWSIAARADVPATVVVEAVRALTSLDEGEDGRRLLDGLGVKQFVAATRGEYVALVNYLKG